jgi:hypothetical protein
METSSSAGLDEEMEEWREKLLNKGKLILYNPAPIEKYYGPLCGKQLEEKS